MKLVVTGASRGIGLEIARQAAARGDEVIAAARDPLAPALAEAAEASGRRIETARLDVTQPESCRALALALAGFELDLLVCNAGVYRGRGRIGDVDFPPEDWAETFAVNVAGVFFTIDALGPLLTRPGGRIAVISSQMGSSARANGGSYSYRASKAAATNLAANLALDLREHGVWVGAYHPGWVRTDMGTAAADISVEQSAAGLLERFDALGPETTGVFEGWDGAPMPY